jgi:hypothetical protein
MRRPIKASNGIRTAAKCGIAQAMLSLKPYLFERLADFDEYLTNSHIFNNAASSTMRSKWKLNSSSIHIDIRRAVRPSHLCGVHD